MATGGGFPVIEAAPMCMGEAGWRRLVFGYPSYPNWDIGDTALLEDIERAALVADL